MDEEAELLSRLQGLEVPAVSAWPAIGWWLLAVLLLLVLFGGLWWRRRYRHDAWRREANAAIEDLRAAADREPAEVVLRRCSALARRLLLIAEPRAEVAALHGEPWLERLDAAARQPVFTQGFGRLLLEQPYQRAPQVPPHDLQALVDALAVLLGAIRPHRSAGRTTRGRADT